MNKRNTIIFLHGPSLYDFRDRPVLHGPISDVIPSSPVFEMYPIGFLSLCAHLEKAGFTTRIINVANKMLQSSRYDPEEEIRGLHPMAFAIDLHWLPHVQGSLRLGEIIKKYHPGTPVIYGGYSASYFHRELIRYPFVDFVIRGDAAERPLVQLASLLREGGGFIGGGGFAGGEGFENVSNLTYRSLSGKTMVNRMAHVPIDGDDVITDYSLPAWKAVRYRDLTGQIPFSGWLKYPVTGVFLYKGCRYDCKTCGGSRSGSETVLSRKRLGYKSPKKVGVELNQIQSLFSAPTMIVGDIQQNGRAYQSELLKEIKRIGFRNELAFEFFRPPSADLIREISESVSRFNVEMSPESHNEHIRNVFGRPFGNAELERAIEACLKYGAGRVDLFFMIGLPGQTQSSVLRTIDYCEDLLKRYGHKRTIYPFIAPLAPFIDPGSAIWEDPEKFGYRLFARTLEEHRILMEKAETWKDFLNYETLWMSREKIVESTYQASLRLNRIKQEFGLITDEEAERVDHAGRKAMAYLNDLKSFYRDFDFQGMESEGTGKHDVSFGDGTICFKRELNWPVDESGFRILPIASIIFRSFWRRVVPRSLLSNEKSLPLEGLFNLKKRSLLQNFNVPVERRGER